jgi:hypothetical protein
MSSDSIKPLVFISYAHADEPDPPELPAEGKIRWLSFVMGFLRPGVKGRKYEVWMDRLMSGGADWNPEIEAEARACDIFVLLVSANSTGSDYIIDKEIPIGTARRARNSANSTPSSPAAAASPTCRRASELFNICTMVCILEIYLTLFQSCRVAEKEA